MNNLNAIAKILIITGIMILVVGVLFLLLDKFTSFSFRLPGDILIRKKYFVFYFPLGLCILISILLTFLLRIFR
ncbi:MAG: DUF2905 domain-containing protein [Atribacterota bacterium]|nr:DUF2905 domain-containing protein [Atribacterota bacterium]MDD4896705.1 DUF2905 domain-containing protein [Atribacterota bacterium]MDD5637510.1 DUF2905 domain-containing protein [Atribacterota bacterium]